MGVERVTIVAGGTGGLGRAVSLTFLEAGDRVIVISYAGYDEAAHQGGAYGVREGEGGVFGTTGGGTYKGGLHVERRPVIETDEDRAEEEK